MANIKIPYPMVPAVALEQRREQMKSAIARGLPRLERQARTKDVLHVACFGPSLRETYEELRGKHPLMSMSGATKFLAARGIIPDYHLEMDPRKSQLVVSLPPVPGVTYLVASIVCPEYFDELQKVGDDNVILWHTVSSNWDDDLKWVSQYDRGNLLVHAGQTVGLAALQVGGVMGYSRFEIHGMDGSFSEQGSRHAAYHGGKTQPPDTTWNAGGKTYRTSKIMANAVAETINTAKNFPIITVWHGDGLTQALIREANLQNACCADETDKRQRLLRLQPLIIKAPRIQAKTTFWDSLLQYLQPEDLPELVRNISLCEPRRSLAKYNTGSIPFETATYLRALCRFYKPSAVAEIGTFIGTSTLALKSERVIYTCDRSNDCVPATESIITHPYQSSTQMLRDIQEPVDFFFFDGRIQPLDLSEIKRLMHERTIFAFDDYTGREKGVANVEMIASLMPMHALVTPVKGPSTLAVSIPVQR